jgi:hypothetical protein
MEECFAISQSLLLLLLHCTQRKCNFSVLSCIGLPSPGFLMCLAHQHCAHANHCRAAGFNGPVFLDTAIL